MRHGIHGSPRRSFASKATVPEPGRVFLMQSSIPLHQGNSAHVLGRPVLLQKTLPERPGRLCRLSGEVLLLQSNFRQLLSRAFLMQSNRSPL
jgi:hypothetical protein